MRIGRTIPPAASPIYLKDILSGLKGCVPSMKEMERFHSELKEYFGVRYIYLVSSGKAALALILKALHRLHPDRDEVLIPAFCCYSVPSAIIRAGLKVKLCDVDPETLDFQFNQLEESITKSNSKGKMLAIVPVHLFGLTSDIERIKKLVVDQAIAVVEDAAQVMGSELMGKKLGTLGDVGFFSLGRSKSISTVEGGVILTNNDQVAEQITLQFGDIPDYSRVELIKLWLQTLLLSVFQNPSFFWFPKSLPFLRVGDTIYDPEFKIRKLSGFQAGLAKSWKARLFEYTKSRRGSALLWTNLLRSTAISSYSCSANGSYNFIRYPIRIENRNIWELALRRSEKLGLGIQLTYPDSISEITELRSEFKGKDFPAAKKLTREILTLPVHPLVTENDIAKIESYIKFLNAKCTSL